MPPANRADTAEEIRVKAAQFERAKPLPAHIDNGDEALYADKIGNYSKGLPHNSFGEVNLAAYGKLHTAVTTGKPSDFEAIPLGGPDACHSVKLVNPQSGLAFDLEGADSHSLSIPPSPKVASAERAAEMVELYWMALCRDVPFSMYGLEPLTQGAISDLNNLTAFTGPKDSVTNMVTAQTLFRGSTLGELTGPYISQFFLMSAGFGDLATNDPMGNPVQQYIAYKPGLDYMVTVSEWLAVQNGSVSQPKSPNLPFGPNVTVGPRFLFNGRGGTAFVHVDELYQAYFMAALNLLDSLKFNSYDLNNPYQSGPGSTTEAGFGTFGNPHVATLVAEVATRALKAQWFQKWFVHRTLRPEAYGGLVHFTKVGSKHYPVHTDVLNSLALPILNDKYCSYLLPMAFPEGSPQHPSYGSGHATVAGACATIIKAFFNEDMQILNPVQASVDGTSLVPYTGGAVLTVGGEANKIAGNVGMFRNHAGVHWRSDHVQSILLGEQIAISILQDQKYLYNENFAGWSFQMFNGTPVTI